MSKRFDASLSKLKAFCASVSCLSCFDNTIKDDSKFFSLNIGKIYELKAFCYNVSLDTSFFSVNVDKNTKKKFSLFAFLVSL